MSAFGFIYHRNKPFKYVVISDQLVSTVIYQFDRQSFFGLWLCMELEKKGLVLFKPQTYLFSRSLF